MFHRHHSPTPTVPSCPRCGADVDSVSSAFRITAQAPTPAGQMASPCGHALADSEVAALAWTPA